MANSKSAQKALRASEKKRDVNNSRKSRIRTFIRKVDDAIKAKNEPDARTAFKNLEPELMRGVSKKVFKLNTAARKLTRLSAAIRKINAK